MKKELDQEVRDSLGRHVGEWVTIAKQTGVSYDWIRKFCNGLIPNPGINTLRKIRDNMPKLRKRK